MRRSVWKTVWRCIKVHYGGVCGCHWTPLPPHALASLFDFPCRGHLLRSSANPYPPTPTVLKPELKTAKFKCPGGHGSLKYVFAVPTLVGAEPKPGPLSWHPRSSGGLPAPAPEWSCWYVLINPNEKKSLWCLIYSIWNQVFFYISKLRGKNFEKNLLPTKSEKQTDMKQTSILHCLGPWHF